MLRAKQEPPLGIGACVCLLCAGERWGHICRSGLGAAGELSVPAGMAAHRHVLSLRGSSAAGRPGVPAARRMSIFTRTDRSDRPVGDRDASWTTTVRPQPQWRRGLARTLRRDIGAFARPRGRTSAAPCPIVRCVSLTREIPLTGGLKVRGILAPQAGSHPGDCPDAAVRGITDDTLHVLIINEDRGL
jgi:hypothetical protein